VPAVYLVLRNKGKTLLLKRQNTGYQDGKYSMIAGHVEEGEPLTKALIREAKEEANLTLRRKDLKLVHVMHRKSADYERIDFYFLAERWSGELRNMEPNKCSEIAWFSKIPKNTIKNVRIALGHIDKGEFYSERDWLNI
jgi:ADP-ribose pyrophosphatase YjhB (NUDIX family)